MSDARMSDGGDEWEWQGMDETEIFRGVKIKF